MTVNAGTSLDICRLTDRQTGFNSLYFSTLLDKVTGRRWNKTPLFFGHILRLRLRQVMAIVCEIEHSNKFRAYIVSTVAILFVLRLDSFV